MDSGKADIATRFPSVCKNVKPKTVSAGKNVNHEGPRKPGSQHSLTCTPLHRQTYFWVRWENGTKGRKDTELGQDGFCRGGVVTGLGHGRPLRGAHLRLPGFVHGCPPHTELWQQCDGSQSHRTR